MDKKKLILVSLAHLSCDVNGGALPAALPYVRAAYNLDYQATGGLIFAYSCLSSLLQPLLGFFADRHNKPWFIPCGVALAGIGISMLGFLQNYWAIFAGIAISGVGSAFFHPEGARYANRVSGSRKGQGMSFFSIGGNSGFIIGPLLVTAFAGIYGLKGMAVFAVISICMAIILVISISGVSFRFNFAANALKKENICADKQANANCHILKEKQKGENNWPEFLRLMMVIISRSIIFTGCNAFIPLYWVSAYGSSKTAAASALAVFGICGVACNLLGGYLADRYGCVKIIRTAFCLMGPVLFAFAFANELWIAWILLPFLGFVIYLPFSAQVVHGQKLLAKNIGFASGITLGLATTIGGIAQPLLGFAADNCGLNSIFIILACLGILGSLMSFRLS